MSKPDWTPAKYTLGVKGSILKDGHKMFTKDIATDLNRRSFLEMENFKLHKKLSESADKINSITKELEEYLELKEPKGKE